MARILVIDDDAYIRDILIDRARRLDHEAQGAATLQEGAALLEEVAYDLVFLDVRLPDGNGLEMLARLRQQPSAPEVIIITGDGEAQGAEMAIRSGAWDYLQKPFKREEIVLHIKRSIEYRTARQEQARRMVLDTTGMIGESAAMRDCLQQVAQCAGTDTNVLLWGETGTGKELAAKIIHRNSPRAERNLIVVDCAAMPESLAESVLFGHVKGAFTGAERDSEGLILKADGGTLFLDEIGELPPSIQKAFLRVLQERRFRPVGSTTEIESRFRLISATNRDLDRMGGEGRFRADLLHRLCTFAIQLPPLRERKDDIPKLALHYIGILCTKHGLKSKGMLPEFLEVLAAYDWPGNVRELINALEKAILAEPQLPLLYPMFLPNAIRVQFAHRRLPENNATDATPTAGDHECVLAPSELQDPLPSLKDFRANLLARVETIYLQHLLRSTEWDLDRAAAVSGLSKNRLYVLISKYDLRNS